MVSSLRKLKSLIDDAVDLLGQAERDAYEISGDQSGRQGDSALGIPEIPALAGCPEMLELVDQLSALKTKMAAVWTAELSSDLQQESDEEAELEARADAASY